MKATKIILFLFFCNLSFTVFAQIKDVVVNADSITCLTHDTTVCVNVEKNAKFEGGDLRNFGIYVMKNLRYPLEAQIYNCQGKSYIRFVVDWDGKVKDVTVYKSSGHKILDKEAVRVVSQSPVWTSAKNSNVCVPQQFILPVVFKSLGVIK